MHSSPQVASASRLMSGTRLHFLFSPFFYREECGDPLCQPVFWCKQCSGGASDSYGSPQTASEVYVSLPLTTPALDDGSPSAPDSYGSPSFPVQESADSYGSPSFPVQESSDSYGSPSFPIQESADSYGSPGLDGSETAQTEVVGNPLSFQVLETEQAGDDFVGGPADESYGAPTSSGDFLASSQEAADNDGAPQAVPDNYGAPEDQPLPSYGARPLQNSEISETADDNYGAPEAPSPVGYGSPPESPPELEGYQLSEGGPEEKVLPDSTTNDLQDVRYSGKNFDEPLFRDATPLKDSYNAQGVTEGPDGDLENEYSDAEAGVTTGAVAGPEEATR